MAVNRNLIAAALMLLLTAAAVIAIVPEADADDGFTVNAVSEHGTITDGAGNVYTSGDFSGELVLNFEPDKGYEFAEWSIIGDSETVADGRSLTVRNVSSNVTVTAETRNYSPSTNLLSIVDVDGMPEPEDLLVKVWSFGSENFTKTDGVWQAAPCTPLIVGDCAYIRAGGYLYQIDVKTGSVLHYVKSEGLTMDFYHYISYGNGIIYDTTGYKAYDLDLNYLYDIPSALRFVTYYDGYFYGSIQNGNGLYSMFKTSSEPGEDLDSSNTKVNLFGQDADHPLEKFRLFAQYGQYSSFMIENGWIFFLQAISNVGTTGYRAITAFNIETEESVTTEMTGLTGMPWDDGWLTYYNGYFYLTAYCCGLFDGVISGLEDKNSTIMWVKFDFSEGKFGTPNYQDIETPSGDTFKGIASGLVINNGRGYLLVRAVPSVDPGSTSFIAFNIADDGTPVPESAVSSMVPFSHGGIVVNIAHQDEGKIYIYMVPYQNTNQGLYIFTDELADGKWTLKENYDKLSTPVLEWGSQAVRAGPGGELIYYVDSGMVDCYTTADKFSVTVFTMESSTATSSSSIGNNAKSALQNLYPGCIIEGSKVTLGSQTYTVYGFNVAKRTWSEVADLTADYSGTRNSSLINAQYRYIALIVDGAESHLVNKGDAGWYYLSGGSFVKCSLSSTDSMDSSVGKILMYSSAVPSPDDVPLPEVLNVPFGSTVSLTVPADSVKVSETAVASAVLGSDGTISVAGLSVGVTEMTVTVGGTDLALKVNVLPKETVDEDGNRIVESVTVRNEDGGTVRTVSKIVTSADGSSETEESTAHHYDSAGNLVKTTERSYSTVTSGTTTSVDGTAVSKDSAGNIIEKISYSSESSSTSVSGGAIQTETYENSLDELTDIRTDTHTLKTSKNSASRTEVTVSKVNNQDDSVISTSHYVTVADSSVGMSAEVPEGDLEIDASGFSPADYADAVSLLRSAGFSGAVAFTVGASMDSDGRSSAADMGASVTMVSGDARISLSGDALSGLSGDLVFSVAASPQMTDDQLRAAGDAKVFDIVLESGGSAVHSIGAATISVSCSVDLREDESPSVWRIADDGTVTEISGASYSDGVMTFSADHLSLYAIGYPPDSGSDGDSFPAAAVAAIAIAALCIIAAVLIFRRRAKA